MLTQGQYFSLKVKAIIENADRFKNFTAGTMVYCHFITMVDEMNEPYDCQICDSHPSQDYCHQGDAVRFKVKSFTKGRYTIEDITVVVKDVAGIQHSIAVKSDRVAPAPVLAPTNAMVAGKASSVALNAAVSFMSQRPLSMAEELSPAAKIISMADQFYNFLISKERQS